MSSLRNAVQRRNHRERAQPEARAKWGLLEKHKDYSLRAKDYNAKKAKLKRLREKARDRNPDEFAFGMMSGKSSRQGRHGARDPTATLSHDAVKLLKTQDANYLRTIGEKIRRQLDKLEKEARLQQGVGQVLQKKNPSGQRTVFVDSVEEVEGEDDHHDDDDDEDFGDFGSEFEGEESEEEFDFSAPPAQAGKLSKKELEKQEEQRKQMIATRRLKKRAQESRLRRIEILRKQLEDIKAAENELELQRAKMAHAVGGTNKDGIKWKIRERKR